MNINKVPLVLLVEDNDADYEAMQRAFNKAEFNCEFYRCIDGRDALDYLFRAGKYQNLSVAFLPDLILLDLNLPEMDGREVLEKIKTSPDIQHVPILVLTGSSYRVDIQYCYITGANGYIVKPLNFTCLEQSIRYMRGYCFDLKH